MQAVALAGLWVWSQRASKAILAADLLKEKGSTLADHFKFNLIVWYPPRTPAVPDGPKKGSAVAKGILTVEDLAEYRELEIVLTCAHVHDHRPEAASLLNLAALCQRCHNRLDAKMRAEQRAVTRWRHTGMQSLF